MGSETCQRPSIGKPNPDSKETVIHHFLHKFWAIHAITVPKGRSVSGRLYENLVLEKLRTKMRKLRPNTSLQYVHLLHDNAPADTSSTLAPFLKSMYCRTLPTVQTWPRAFFPLSKIEKIDAYDVGYTGQEVHWGLQFTSFL